MPLPRTKRSKIARPRKPKASKWLRLIQLLENIPGTWCEGEILNLPGWKTIRYRECADDLIILAELTTESTECCNCRTAWAEMIKWGYTEVTHVRDLPIRRKRARIYFRLQRRRCKCKQTLQQPLTGVDEQHPSLTHRLGEYISLESFSIFRSFSSTADEAGCSGIMVRNIHTGRAVQLETDRVIEAPRWLAIDEVHPKKNGPEYCVISAPELKQVIDLISNDEDTRKKKRRRKNRKRQGFEKGVDSSVLLRWLLNLKNRENVKVVTIDMNRQYRRIVRRLLKNAVIVVDRYHVHNLLSVALKGVLTVLRDSMTPSEQRRFMRRESLVLKNYRRLSKEKKKDGNGKELPSEKELFVKWLKDVPDLARAYWLTKEFSDILQLSDRQKAEELTDAWLGRVCEFVEYFREKYKKDYRGIWEDPFGNVPNTITEWRTDILNYIDHQKLRKNKATNGFAEFANKQIEKAFQIGNGLKYEVLRVKVIHGGVLVIKRPPHPLDQKWTRSKSDRGARRGPKPQRAANPDSNLALLENARVSQDKTRGLLPDPQLTLGWSERFGTLMQDESISAPDDYLELAEDLEAEKKEPVRRGRRPFKHDSNQFKMF
jgi:transposase